MSSTALAGAVELLDRSLAYTRGALAEVRADHLGLATPCRGWPLTLLLAHMDDGLDAYTQAATGRVSLVANRSLSPIEAIRDKACALLGWWLDHPPAEVGVGDQLLPSQTLVAAAALEITIHGWDLHATVGAPVDVPADLAGPLLTIARVVVGEDDRHGCFAPPVPVAPDAGESQHLLAFLGRG
ncbi:MAG: TIGR03086 family metal-binding protein [Nocardioides sp.]